MDAEYLDHWQSYLAKAERQASLTREESVLIQKLRNCSTDTRDRIRQALDEKDSYCNLIATIRDENGYK